MKISIIASPSWPIPDRHRTGDLFYAQLAETLGKFGHEVSFFAPPGSIASHCKLFPMTCSNGQYNNGKEEEECFNNYADIFRNQDIVHDFSVSKKIAEILLNEGKRNVISTHLGGALSHPNPAYNVITQSHAQKNRLLRGANDYENTPTPDAGGATRQPIKDAHVVYNGIDTNFFTPTYNKQDYFLWFGRLDARLAEELGVPALDVIDVDYAPWHTDDDTMDKLSAQSLEIVGKVMFEVIHRLELQ